MKLLFVHGTKFKEDKEGNLYTGGSYNKDTWHRYLSISGKLSVIARKDPVFYNEKYAQNNFNHFDKRKIKFIEVPNRVASIRSFLNFQKHREINNIIREQVAKSDCLIARLPSGFGNIAIKYAKLFHKPYLVEIVGCPWDSLWNHSIRGKILALNSHLKMKRIVKNAPFAVYVTNEFLQNRYPAQGKNVGCSDVVLQEFDNRILENRLNKIKNKNRNDNTIIGTTAAVDVRYKGQQYVIKALGKLKKRGITNFRYQLVGGGKQSYLKSVAKRYNIIDQVEFLGSVPHDEVIKWLDSIDIYIQPSLTEGLPRALIEAMSRGCPSIGSNVGGIPELLEKDCTFNKSNYNELAQIIFEKGLNKNWLQDKAKRNYEESKKYDKEKIEERRNMFFVEFREHVEKFIR